MTGILQKKDCAASAFLASVAHSTIIAEEAFFGFLYQVTPAGDELRAFLATGCVFKQGSVFHDCHDIGGGTAAACRYFFSICDYQLITPSVYSKRGGAAD